MIYSFQELIDTKLRGKEKVLAVAGADSEHTLEGVIKAYHEGLIRPILIGDSKLVKPMLINLGCHDDFEFIGSSCIEESLKITVDLVKNGKCNTVMKGNMDTKDILRCVLKKENELVARNVLNAITINEIPTYHKLMMVGDPGMNIAPDLGQKVGIIHNCLDALRGLGYEKPKVAILSCVEKVNPKIEATMHAKSLMEMADAGVFGDVELYGPLSWDLIVSKEAAQIKGVESSVCGDADLVIVPDLNTGNTLVKCLSYSAGALGGGLTLGAKVPVITPSRSSTPTAKYRAIVIGCAIDLLKENK